MSATNDAGLTKAQFSFSTLTIDGAPIPAAEIFLEKDMVNGMDSASVESDWILSIIVGIIITAAAFLV